MCVCTFVCVCEAVLLIRPGHIITTVYYDNYTSRVPVVGGSSVCLICMKYRRIILIIIIISPGQISYIANTSRTHACTHAHAHTPRWRSGFRCSMGRCRPTVTARSAGDNGRRCFIQINTCEGDPVSPTFCVFFAYKKITNSLRRLPR